MKLIAAMAVAMMCLLQFDPKAQHSTSKITAIVEAGIPKPSIPQGMVLIYLQAGGFLCPGERVTLEFGGQTLENIPVVMASGPTGIAVLVSRDEEKAIKSAKSVSLIPSH